MSLMTKNLWSSPQATEKQIPQFGVFDGVKYPVSHSERLRMLSVRIEITSVPTFV